MLKGVAALGARTAPLPQALLGAEKPLRAFVGHVEPTFDWTLQQPESGQFLTDGLVQALYTQLFLKRPIGHAMQRAFAKLTGLFNGYDIATKRYKRGEEGARGAMLYYLLAARDLRATVILGDPTGVLP